MKKLILISFLVCLFINNTFSQWVSYSNGIKESESYYLYSTSNKIYAANSYGLYYSTNEGIKWQKFSFDANLRIVLKKDSYLYTGGYDGLFISTDDGISWSHPLNSYNQITGIVFLGTTMFASISYQGIIKSTNNGYNWTQVCGFDWRPVTSLAVKDNYIFAGLGTGEYSPGEVKFSSNGGSNWYSTNLDSVSVKTLYTYNQYLFVGTESNGLYRSSDNGSNWTIMTLPNYPTRMIKNIDNILYISCGLQYSEYNGFYKSTNNGNNWQIINNLRKRNNVVSIDKINNTFIAGVEGGIYISNDNLVSWKHYLHENSTINTLYSFNSRIFAGVINQGIYYSDDNGENWIHTKLNYLNVYDFTFNGANLFAGTDRWSSFQDTGGVFISTDNGINWSITNLRAKIIYALSCFNSKFYAGAAYEKVYTSTDNGINWVFMSSFPTAVPYCFFKTGSKIFAGAYRGSTGTTGLYYTTNEGITWNSINGINSVNKIIANSNYLFGSCNDSTGPVRSSDNGLTWTTTSLNKGTWSMAIDNNYVFAGTTMNGVYISSDNGTTWRAKNEGLEDNNIHGLLIYNGYIFAGSYGKGIYRRTLQDITSVNNISSNIPGNFSLSQNYPNPFNPTTTISFKVKSHKVIKLIVYDILGKEIETLVNEKQSPGTYQVNWNASNYPSGIYFYTLFADGERIDTKKMVLLK